MQLGDITKAVEGKLIGDPGLTCFGADVLDEAGPGQITMIDSAKRAASLKDCQASAVVTPCQIEADHPQIIVDDVHVAFSAIIKLFRPPHDVAVLPDGIDPSAKLDSTAVIHPSAVIGANVTIGKRTRVMPGVVILPGTTIGEDCVVHPSVTIYEHTQIADRVIIHAGCTLGAHGFGYRLEEGRHIPSAQLGYVAIESDVELGASVTVDRGTYGSTRIGEGTKVDNQVMIAHNCQIGKHNLICSQVGIAGSCRTGDYVILAGQVGLKDHVTLGDHAIVGAQAGVMEDLAGNSVYLGSPARPQRDQMQIFALQRRLPDMRKDLKRLQQEVAQLQRRIDGETRQVA